MAYAQGVFSKKAILHRARVDRARQVRQEVGDLAKAAQEAESQERLQRMQHIQRLQSLEREYETMFEQQTERRRLRSHKLRTLRSLHLSDPVSLRLSDPVSQSLDVGQRTRDQRLAEVSNSPSPKSEVKWVLVQRGYEIMKLHILGEGGPRTRKRSIPPEPMEEVVIETSSNSSIEEDKMQETPDKVEGKIDRMKKYWLDTVKPNFLPEISPSATLNRQLRIQRPSAPRKLTLNRVTLRQLSVPPQASDS